MINQTLSDENRRFLHTLAQMGYLNKDVNTIISEYFGVQKKKKKRKKKIRINLNDNAQEVYHNTTLPYCGKIITGNCLAMRKNHGLFTQCKNKHLDHCDYCNVCNESSKNSPTEKPTYGDIRERDKLVNNKSLKVINFGNIVEKLQLDKNKCIESATKLGWTIPTEQWEIKKTKRGRPKSIKPNIVVVEDSDEEDYECDDICDEDIIAHLISSCD